MSVHSKKESEDMYGGMFGDLPTLASDDTGEINSFASDVINREVSANRFTDLFSALSRKIGDGWTAIRHIGDHDAKDVATRWRQEKYLNEAIDPLNTGKRNFNLTNPQIFRQFIADIDAQAQQIVTKAIEKQRRAPEIAILDAEKALQNAKAYQKQAELDKAAAEVAHNALQNSTDMAAKNAAKAEFDRASAALTVYESRLRAANDNFVQTRLKNHTPEARDAANARADEMEKHRGDYAQAIQNKIKSALNKPGGVELGANDFKISVNDSVTVPGKKRQLPAIEVETIKLDKAKYNNVIDTIKNEKNEIAKARGEVQTRIDARPPKKGDTKVVDGKKWYFNGKLWLLVGGAAAALAYKDEIQGAYESYKNNNQDVNVGSKTTGQESDDKSSDLSSGYDPYKSHETSPEDMNKWAPGGSYPNTQPSKSYEEDPWDKFKTKSPAQQRKFESGSDDDSGWWNAPGVSKPKYDDMGYVGGSDESWARTALKSGPNAGELDDSELADYGADQLIAAQNFLSYYGLGTEKQPGIQIINSLLMGSFDGKSFEEYKNTHSEAEVRDAMKRFGQGLSMFNAQMGSLAKNLESFYQEQQRRIESETLKPKSNEQPNEQSNEQSERTQ
jgi:hypothetical protein